MVHLDLTDKETTILDAAMESYLSDLRYEIGNTDSLDYRNMLKERKAVLRKLVNILADSKTS